VSIWSGALSLSPAILAAPGKCVKGA